MSSRRHLILRFCLFTLLILIAVVVTLFTPIGDCFRKEAIAQYAASLGPWGPVGLVLVSLVMPLLFLPRWPVAWVCGLTYGLFWGVLLSTLASTLGACLHYALARTLLAPSAEAALKRTRFGSHRFTDRDAFFLFFFLRAFPLSNSVATNLVGGALRVRPIIYVATTFLGMIPSSVMYASWGQAMSERSGSSYGAVIISVILVLTGLIYARRCFAPWLRRIEAVGPEV